MAAKFTKQQILEFLRKYPIMNIAVVGENKPISSVLLFAIDDDFNIYFGTHEDTFKAQALLKNPKISLSVWQHDIMMVQADGVATQVTDKKVIEETIDKIINSTDNLDGFWPPVVRIKNHSSYVVFCIKLNWLKATDLENKNITDREPTHTELTFN